MLKFPINLPAFEPALAALEAMMVGGAELF